MEALFRKFQINLRIGDVYKMSEEELGHFQAAMAEFSRRLGKGPKGTKLVQAVYAIVDGLTAQYLTNHQIACKKGCGWCCYQLVCSTTLEMRLIVDYLSSLQRRQRSQICHQASEKARLFYLQNQKLLTSNRRWQEIGEGLRIRHHGKPCVFLSDDSVCGIYPVRPIDCRSARSLDSCGKYTGEKPQLRKVSFIFDQVASNLIMDEEEKTSGGRNIVPLIGWPISQQFGWFFDRYK